MKFKLFIFLFASAVLTSCGPSASDYLDVNISKWNTAISDMNALYNLVDDIETVEDFAGIKQRVEWTLEALDNRMDGLNTEGALLPDDVKEMNTALMDYLKASKEEVLIYQELADKATSITDEQLEEIYQKLDALETKANDLSDAASKAQDDFAKKHDLELHIVPSKNK